MFISDYLQQSHSSGIVLSRSATDSPYFQTTNVEKQQNKEMFQYICSFFMLTCNASFTRKKRTFPKSFRKMSL